MTTFAKIKSKRTSDTAWSRLARIGRTPLCPLVSSIERRENTLPPTKNPKQKANPPRNECFTAARLVQRPLDLQHDGAAGITPRSACDHPTSTPRRGVRPIHHLQR
jgi:hypothetical protein